MLIQKLKEILQDIIDKFRNAFFKNFQKHRLIKVSSPIKYRS